MMSINLDDLIVKDNPEAKRYEAKLPDGKLAIMEYMLATGRIIFTHTEVPVEWEGHGIANKMAQVVLDEARTKGLQVMPLCPFVKAYVARHKAYHDIAFGFGAKPIL